MRKVMQSTTHAYLVFLLCGCGELVPRRCLFRERGSVGESRLLCAFIIIFQITKLIFATEAAPRSDILPSIDNILACHVFYIAP